jgi:hypothetical protein
MLAARTHDHQLSSVLVREATELVFSGCRFNGAKPFDLAVEKISSGWCLELATSFQGRLSLPAGLKLFEHRTGAVSLSVDGNLNLPAGRYIFAPQPPTADEIEGARPSIASAKSPKLPAVASASRPLFALSGVRVGWEAEAPHKESFGRAHEEQRADASGGRALLSIGTETPWHRISWPVIVPKQGSYRLRLRYNLSQPESRVQVQVWSLSGQHRDYLCVLPGPKGWSSEREWTVKTIGWREIDAVDAAGRELLIPLEAGRQILTLASPSEGINLDAITLDGTNETTTR